MLPHRRSFEAPRFQRFGDGYPRLSPGKRGQLGLHGLFEAIEKEA